MKTTDRSPRILIVDDSLVARRLLTAQLNELGITEIVEAQSGVEGMQKLEESLAKKCPFDLIITDLRMPLMSGANFLQNLRKDSVYNNIPKLIASVETDCGTVMDAVLTGADGYILKPTTAEVLKEKLAKAFARKKAS